MRKLLVILMAALCLAWTAVPAGAEVERHVLLDNAFKMLEEGNICRRLTEYYMDAATVLSRAKALPLCCMTEERSFISSY